MNSRHSELLHQAYAGDKQLVRFEGDHNARRPEFFYTNVSIFFHQTLQLEEMLMSAAPVDQLLKSLPMQPVRWVGLGAAAGGRPARLGPSVADAHCLSASQLPCAPKCVMGLGSAVALSCGMWDRRRCRQCWYTLSWLRLTISRCSCCCARDAAGGATPRDMAASLRALVTDGAEPVDTSAMDSHALDDIGDEETEEEVGSLGDDALIYELESLLSDTEEEEEEEESEEAAASGRGKACRASSPQQHGAYVACVHIQFHWICGHDSPRPQLVLGHQRPASGLSHARVLPSPPVAGEAAA